MCFSTGEGALSHIGRSL